MPTQRPSLWRRLLSMLGLGAGDAASAPAEPRPTAGGSLDPASFEPGDFLWPKRKGAIVVRALPGEPASAEARQWQAERDRRLGPQTRSVQYPEVAERLRSMRYEEFERYYFEGASESAVSRGIDIGGVKVSAGHVGIIEIGSDGMPYVIEAVPTGPLAILGGGTVQRSPYQEWLARRPDNQFWHGRLRGVDGAVRARITDEAARHLGKPYDIFNFDLDDDSAFYCSKLAWMSVWRATAIAVDDDPNPKRGDRFPPWFSPKQLLNAPRILVLSKPADY
ncbi:MAG TPA: YiiX/YebB-like N1pC/P60 family cysteine hydrolase [Hyphomicrobiaceae bacterium]|nr:YiiX/YebB-like N1pC/P60 family cysteine hydrolase [Hyphomicrobiaceae bacterium]